MYAALTLTFQFNVSLGNLKLAEDSKVSLLGYDEEISWTTGNNNTVVITMPQLPPDTNLKWAWVFKFDKASPK